jgi:formate dehydrogenase major subunit
LQTYSLSRTKYYNEASANLIINEALDPAAKILEFKFCAVKATPGGTLGTRIN